MRESELIVTPVLPGEVVKACYKGTEIPVDLTVQIVEEDKVVLSRDRKRAVIVPTEVLKNGGEADRFEFKPLELGEEG